MLTLDPAGLLGLAALVLLALLIVKIALQSSEDAVAKGLRLILLLAFFAMICNQFFAVADLYQVFPHYSFATVGLMFSIGPLLYCVVQRLTTGRAPWHLPQWPWHWMLPVIVTVAFIPYFWQSTEIKSEFIQTSEARKLVMGLYIVNYLQIGVYLLLCRRSLQAFRHTLLNHFSAIKQINLTWIQLICWGLWILIFLDLFLPLLGLVSNSLYSVFLLANSLFIVVVTYAALGRSPLQSPPELATDCSSDRDKLLSSDMKYTRSGLSQDSARYLVGKLQRGMAEKQLYLQEDLSLYALAEALNSPAHHISQALNEQLGKSFYDFVNEYRIDYAQKLLLQNKELAVVDVALASGFGNKVTFYNAFKRYVGKTPSQFRRQSLQTPPT